MTDRNYGSYVFDFERLEVYQLALRFASKAIQVVKNLPPHLKFSVGGNFIRAAMSIAHNIAEGSGQKSKNDKIRFYRYSLSSVRECIPPITVLLIERQISEGEKNDLRTDCISLGNMIVGLIKKA